MYMQLCHRLEGLLSPPYRTASQMGTEIRMPAPNKEEIFLQGLDKVPKSGEVWTEGARCRLNPMLTASFDVGMAQSSSPLPYNLLHNMATHS